MTIAQENAELKTQLEAATAGKEQATGEAVELKAQVEKLATAQTGLLEKCGQLESDLTEAKTDQVDVEEMAGAQAAEIVARQGALPVDEDADEGSKAKTLEDLWKDYSAIEDLKEKTVFYRTEIKPKL